MKFDFNKLLFMRFKVASLGVIFGFEFLDSVCSVTLNFDSINYVHSTQNRLLISTYVFVI
jgi:hypothetical protein